MLYEPANLAEWDLIAQFTSLQAGYLWFGKQPKSWGVLTPEHIKAKAEEIAEALALYPPEGEVFAKLYRGESFLANKREKASRMELIELAQSWDQYPEFLFPDKRQEPIKPEPLQYGSSLLSPATLQALEKYSAGYSNFFTEGTVQAEPVSGASGRRDLQVQKIMGFITELKYDPKQIPEGGKGIIKKRCLEIAELFSKDSFKKAWQEARDRELIDVEDIDKYRPANGGKP